MACLALYRDKLHPLIVVANPVFVTSPIELQNGAEVTFEVFERDAAALKTLVNKEQRYVLDSTEPFWAQLKSLEPCESTHPGLANLRHKETLKGIMSVKRMEETWFERELDVFRDEIEWAIRFFHSHLAVHDVAARSKSVYGLLNETALFWNTSLQALLTAAFITLGRVFDQQSKHNLDRLISLARDNLYIFSKEALGRRKQGPDLVPPEWLDDFLRDVIVPTPEDFRTLQRDVKKWRRIYERTYRDIRRRFFAHKEVSDLMDIAELFGKTNIDELQRMLNFLSSLNDAFWMLFYNGIQLDLSSPARDSTVQGLIRREVEQFLLKAAGVTQYEA